MGRYWVLAWTRMGCVRRSVQHLKAQQPKGPFSAGPTCSRLLAAHLTWDLGERSSTSTSLRAHASTRPFEPPSATAAPSIRAPRRRPIPPHRSPLLSRPPSGGGARLRITSAPPHPNGRARTQPHRPPRHPSQREPSVRAVGDLVRRAVVVGPVRRGSGRRTPLRGAQDMFGSGLNLVSAALGFGMTAAFVAFVCARFICCRARRAPPQPSSPSDFPADLDHPIEHACRGLEPLAVAAIPTIKYDREAFRSNDDAQCSICLGEYKEKEMLRILPTCHHNFHLVCLDLWLQKQTTCPICRISLKELQAGMPSARSIQQLPTVPENCVNPTHQLFIPVHQDHQGQNNSSGTQESEVVIEIRQ